MVAFLTCGRTLFAKNIIQRCRVVLIKHSRCFLLRNVSNTAVELFNTSSGLWGWLDVVYADCKLSL